MGLLARIKNIFSPSPCLACEVYKKYLDEITEHYKDQINYLRGLDSDDRESLKVALRLNKPVDKTTPIDQIKTDPVGRKSWHALKAELEKKHKRAPEDKVEEYWKGKAAVMEKEVNDLLQKEVLVDDPSISEYQKDRAVMEESF